MTASRTSIVMMAAEKANAMLPSELNTPNILSVGEVPGRPSRSPRRLLAPMAPRAMAMTP